ncbi:MAG: FtsX-like permease family protein [Rikenellaceae bacterium]
MFLFARRYLFSPKSHSMVNIIASVSLLSVSTPIAAVIILLSIFNGFGALINDINSAIDADITVRASRSGVLLNVSQLDTLKLRRMEGVEGLALMCEQSVLLEHNGNQTLLKLRGIDKHIESVNNPAQHASVGVFETELGDLDRIVVSNTTANRLKITNLSETYIKIYALSESKFSGMLPMVNFAQDSAKVTGTYRLDAQSEELYAFTSLRLMERLSSSDEGSFTDLVIKLREGVNHQHFASTLERELGDDFKVLTKVQLNPMIYDIIKYEKMGIILISSMVMLLAAFSLIGSIAMLIIEKRSEFITLRSMGATWQYIRGIFICEGLLLSGVASICGAIVGVGFTLAQEWWGFIKIPSENFMITAYPIELRVGDVVATLSISLIITVTLSYIVSKEMVKNR